MTRRVASLIAISLAIAASERDVARGAESWSVFPSHDTSGIYLGIVAGPDGAMWLTDYGTGLVRIDASGKREIVPLTFRRGNTNHRFLPAAIALGTDGSFYLTGCVDVSSNCSLVAIAPTTGSLAVYPTPSGDSPRFGGIGPGPDGNVWFAEPGHIAKISPAGAIVEYSYPSGEQTNSFSGVATGSDAHVWFTEFDPIVVGNIDPTSGKITEYSLKSQKIDCGPSGMAGAADGKLYFGCGTGIVAISTAGVARYSQTGYQLSDSPLDVATGPDGNAWAAVLSALQQVKAGEVITYVPPKSPLTMYASALGTDKRLWILCEDGTVFTFAPIGGGRAR